MRGSARRGSARLYRGIAALSLAVSGCGGGSEPDPVAFSAEAQSLVVRLRGVAFQRFVDDQLEFEVRSSGGVFEPDRRLAQLQDVQTYFRGDERGELRMSAQHGEFDFKRQNFQMSGDVEGNTPNGEHFSTSKARYDKSRAQILVDDPVTLESGRVRSSGSGLVFDLPTRELTLFDIEGRREGAK